MKALSFGLLLLSFGAWAVPAAAQYTDPALDRRAAADADDDPALDETHFQIGPRIGGIVAPTFASHPVAEVVRAGLDVGVRFSRYFDLRIEPTFLYETSDYDQAFFGGAMAAALFWVAPEIYALGVGIGGGYMSGSERPHMSSALDGESGWVAIYATPVALQFGNDVARFELSLDIGIVDITAPGVVRPFATVNVGVLFWT